MSQYLRASNANQLLNCVGSANLELALPGYVEPDAPPGEAAIVGTRIHELIEELTLLMLTPTGQLTRDSDQQQLFQDYCDALVIYAALHWSKKKLLVGDYDANAEALLGVIAAPLLSAEKLESLAVLKPRHIRFAVRAVNTTLTDYYMDWSEQCDHAQAVFRCEQRIKADWLRAENPVQYEELRTPTVTADCIVTCEDCDAITIIDYKTGSIPVEAAHNDQLLFYAKTVVAQKMYNNIVLRIIQPIQDSEFTLTPEYLKDWTEMAIRQFNRIQRKELELVAGDHCKFCPANPHTRGQKANVVCYVKLEELYPSNQTDEQELLNL